MRSALLILPAAFLTACSAAVPTAGDTTPPSARPAASATPAPAASPSPEPVRAASAERAEVVGTQVVGGAAAGELSVGTSAALFTSSPVVVLVGEGDPAELARAVELGPRLGVPVLVVPPAGAPAGGADAEVARLGATTAVVLGTSAAGWAERLDGVEVVSPGEAAELPTPAPAAGTTVLVTPGEASLAAAANARAAGAEVVEVPGGDPRATSEAVTRLAGLTPDRVLAVGSAFGAADRLAPRVRVAATGAQLPGGGQLVLPGKRYVALYGHPGSTRLGVLGEQGAEASVNRAVELATEYAELDAGVQAVPTFEIIATVASSAAGADGDYSSESTIEHLRPYVDAAARVGVYVVLDLQPGYADFLSQAKLYEELLRLPHVGLALDPEWRLRPGERHLQQIGRVGADEVNAVADWLATLVRENDLPQKMLLLHQFRTFMLEERERIVSDRDELAVITQMDGNGPPSTKLDTWNILRPGAPAGMTFGWKNFYDEDQPMLTPAQTLAVQPTPVFVSYQ